MDKKLYDEFENWLRKYLLLYYSSCQNDNDLIINNLNVYKILSLKIDELKNYLIIGVFRFYSLSICYKIKKKLKEVLYN